MNKDLDYSMNNKRLIRIRTMHPDGDAYDGIVLNYNRNYVVIREVRDFELDGINVIPKKWIKSIRNGKLERSNDNVLSFCGTIGGLSETGWLHGMRTMEEIMDYLREQGTWPGVEVVRDTESSLYIGEITEVSEDSFRMYCYDAEGKWE